MEVPVHQKWQETFRKMQSMDIINNQVKHAHKGDILQILGHTQKQK
jgi:hypothetical protein